MTTWLIILIAILLAVIFFLLFVIGFDASGGKR